MSWWAKRNSFGNKAKCTWCQQRPCVRQELPPQPWIVFEILLMPGELFLVSCPVSHWQTSWTTVQPTSPVNLYIFSQLSFNINSTVLKTIFRLDLLHALLQMNSVSSGRYIEFWSMACFFLQEISLTQSSPAGVGKTVHWCLGNNPAVGAKTPWMGGQQPRSPQLVSFGVAPLTYEMEKGQSGPRVFPAMPDLRQSSISWGGTGEKKDAPTSGLYSPRT